MVPITYLVGVRVGVADTHLVVVTGRIDVTLLIPVLVGIRAGVGTSRTTLVRVGLMVRYPHTVPVLVRIMSRLPWVVGLALLVAGCTPPNVIHEYTKEPLLFQCSPQGFVEMALYRSPRVWWKISVNPRFPLGGTPADGEKFVHCGAR